MFLKSKINITIISLLLFMMFSSCENSKEDKQLDNVILVKIGTEQLSKNELDKILPSFENEDDSIRFVNDYINTWLLDKLLYREAKKQLKDVSEIEGQIRDYRELLYIREYYNQILFPTMKVENLDSAVESYYKKYLSNYKLSNTHLKAYYITLSPKITVYYPLLQKAKKYSRDNKVELLDMCLGSEKEVYFCDLWTDIETFANTINYTNISLLENEISYNIDNPFSFVAGDFRYIVKVDSIVKSGETTPLELVRDKIVQIVLNNKKNDLIIQKKRELLEQAESSKIIIKNNN